MTNEVDSNLDVKNTKITNGLYYGVGVGCEYENFFAELAWSNTKASLSWDKFENNTKTSYKMDNHDYSTISVNVGYKFNF